MSRTEEHASIEAAARAHAATAAEAYADLARYLRALPAQDWGARTGCSAWTMRDLAGHVVGEAVWFPILVRGVTRGEHPLPNEVHESLKTLPPDELADRMEQSARRTPTVGVAPDRTTTVPEAPRSGRRGPPGRRRS